MLILGIDPSPVHIGWALIDRDGWRATWQDGGVADLERAKVQIGSHHPVWVAIELPAPRNPKAIKAVAATIGVAWYLHGYCEGRGLPVVMVTPEAWRAQIIGAVRRRPGGPTIDAMCREALPRHCRGVPERLSCHARDAAGVAIAGARISGAGRKVG